MERGRDNDARLIAFVLLNFPISPPEALCIIISSEGELKCLGSYSPRAHREDFACDSSAFVNRESYAIVCLILIPTDVPRHEDDLADKP